MYFLGIFNPLDLLEETMVMEIQTSQYFSYAKLKS
jgi:hypothetical protein